jgi:acyl-CoA thioesterase-1
MKRGLSLIAMMFVGALCCGPGYAGPGLNLCEAPDDAAGVVTPLPHVAAALKPGSTLDVLAVGSASLFGPEASIAPGGATNQAVSGATTAGTPPAQIITAHPSDTSFLKQMAKALEAAVPGAKVSVTVRGGRGLSAADQLSLLEDTLDHGHYSLVIWQTGTVEAVRNTPPSEFGQTLADGAARVESAGSDLVLIDPQFSRFLQTNSNIEPYEQAFQQLGSLPGVLLFRRFDLMRAWVNEGQIDLERTPKADRKHIVEQLHACLGLHLARMVLSGARS